MQKFLVLSSFAWFFYFVQNILSRIEDVYKTNGITNFAMSQEKCLTYY